MTARKPAHEIEGVDHVRKGHVARCSCGRRFPVRVEEDTAWRDAADHRVSEMLAALARRYRRPTSLVRAIRADGELAAIAEQLTHRQAS